MKWNENEMKWNENEMKWNEMKMNEININGNIFIYLFIYFLFILLSFFTSYLFLPHTKKVPTHISPGHISRIGAVFICIM